MEFGREKKGQGKNEQKKSSASRQKFFFAEENQKHDNAENDPDKVKHFLPGEGKSLCGKVGPGVQEIGEIQNGVEDLREGKADSGGEVRKKDRTDDRKEGEPHSGKDEEGRIEKRQCFFPGISLRRRSVFPFPEKGVQKFQKQEEDQPFRIHMGVGEKRDENAVKKKMLFSLRIQGSDQRKQKGNGGVAPGKDAVPVEHGSGKDRRGFQKTVEPGVEQDEIHGGNGKKPGKNAVKLRRKARKEEGLENEIPQKEMPFVFHLFEEAGNGKIPCQKTALQFVPPGLMGKDHDEGKGAPEEKGGPLVSVFFERRQKAFHVFSRLSTIRSFGKKSSLFSAEECFPFPGKAGTEIEMCSKRAIVKKHFPFLCGKQWKTKEFCHIAENERKEK